MDWIKTAVEALTATRVLVIGSIFALATLFVRFVSEISWRGHLLLDAPTWAIWVIVVLALLLFFFLSYANRKRKELVPKVDLAFDVVQTPTIIVAQVNGQLTQTPSNGTYARVRIETATKGIVKDCVAFVSKIEKKNNSSKKFEPIELPDPFLLTANPIIVYSNIPTFITFFQVGEDNVPQLPPPWPLKLQGAFNEAASYRFTISVSAGGVTTDRQVEVNWPGAWDKVIVASI